MADETEKKELDADEAARVDKAAALGIISEEEKEELLGGINVGFGEEPAAEGEEEPAAAAAPAAEGEQIQIGDQLFDTKEAAFEYAQKLESERTVGDSYRQGIQDALSHQQGNLPAAEPAPAENFDEKFYENPAEFIANAVAKAKAEAKDEALTEIGQASATEKLWQTFYKENPDLETKDKLVKTILQDNWAELGNMKDHKAAMKILSKKTRDQLNSWLEEAKPREELGNVRTTASPGGSVGVTSKKTPDKALDFISQLRQNQDKRMASS